MRIGGLYSIGVLLLLSCSAICLSCTKENDLDLTNEGDELGVSCDDSFDRYGVEVWTPHEGYTFTTLYTRIDTLYGNSEGSQSIQYYTVDGEESNVRWNSSAFITDSHTSKEWRGVDAGGYLCESSVFYEFSEIEESLTIEALVTTNGRVVRRFQTIPVRREELTCDVLGYTFGTPIEQMLGMINTDSPLNTVNVKQSALSRWNAFSELLRFMDSPDRRLVTVYCTGIGTLIGGADFIAVCEKSHIPESPEFERDSEQSEYRVLNPQQWEFNG